MDTLKLHSGKVYGLVREGDRLISASGDKTIKVEYLLLFLLTDLFLFPLFV